MVFGLLDITRDTFLAPIGLLSLSHTFFFEIIDMVIMAFAIGYIFSDYIQKPVSSNYDPLRAAKRGSWDKIKFAALAAGPAVVLHELAHKFVAMAYGAEAILYAPYGFYALVAVLKLIGFPFLFLVGGFVAHTPLPALPTALVALSGPLINFLLWFFSLQAVKHNLVKQKYLALLVPFAKLNLFLAIFNMLPIPGFDGFSFFRSLLAVFTG